jgi:hypothetical protein
MPPLVELIFKGALPKTEADEAALGDRIVFSPDAVHPYPETGHEIYLRAVVRLLGKIRNVGQAEPHSNGKPPALPGRLPEFDNSGIVRRRSVTLGRMRRECGERLQQPLIRRALAQLRSGQATNSHHLPRRAGPCRAGDGHRSETPNMGCALNHRPKGRAALSRSTSVKPPALPEVADSLPPPFVEDNWELAQMIPFSRAKLSSGWDRLDPGTNGIAKRVSNRLPELWKASQPGETISFRFRGTTVKI